MSIISLNRHNFNKS